MSAIFSPTPKRDSLLRSMKRSPTSTWDHRARLKELEKPPRPTGTEIPTGNKVRVELSPVLLRGRLPMKHFAPFFILLAAFLAPASLDAATSAPARFNTVVVNHFNNGSGMSQSPDFIHYFSDDLSEGL